MVPLKCSKDDYRYLMNAFELSAQVWNLCVDIETRHRSCNGGKWIDRSLLQKETKKCVDLSAKVIQHTVHKYLYSRDAAFRARKSGRIDVRYPYKKKRYFVVGWDSQSVKICENHLKLSKMSVNNKRQNPVICYVKDIPENIVEVELVYKDKPYLMIKYKEYILYEIKEINNHASIDLGEIHTTTSIDSNGDAIIVTGRKLREMKYFRNKQQSRVYKRLNRCTKGSRQYYKYRRVLRNIRFKTERKTNDTVHKITKLYLDFCLENQISVVYYGDLDSATRGTKQKHKGNGFVRQKLGQWNYGQIVKQLENKLSRHGIKMIKVNEAYTSQTCPNCKHRYHPSGRNYICKECGYRQHRDIVGAINILNFNDSCNLTRYRSKKYLRIA